MYIFNLVSPDHTDVISVVALGFQAEQRPFTCIRDRKRQILNSLINSKGPFKVKNGCIK